MRITPTPEQAGERLDVVLAAHLDCSRARAQGLIEAGRVRVAGALRQKRYAVALADAIEVELPTPAAPAPAAEPAEVPFEVCYEDDDLLVVDKPAGVVVHPARGHWEGTLAQGLEGLGAAGGEDGRAGIVHRLDRDTSGLLVVARHEAAHAALKELLAQRRIHREYAALVEGHPPSRSGTIDAPIGRDRRNRLLMSIDSDEPREARTHFEVERLLPRTTLLRVLLETGRTHQIRVHLGAIGLPVVGDPSYGGRITLGLERQFLHAARLSFPHPLTDAEIDISSPLPDDLAAALQRAQ